MGPGAPHKQNSQITVSSRDIEDFLNLFENDTASAIKAIERFSHTSTQQQLHSTEPPKDGEIIISIRDVSKSYKLGRQKIDVLNAISLNIYKGQLVALTGPSGSGKTTLLHILGCIDTPTSGQVIVDEQEVSKLRDGALSRIRQEKIGFVFQSFYLQPFLRLDDNVSVPAMFTHEKRKKINKRGAMLIERVGLSDYTKHYPKELSGGQIQRTAIARALINNPAIIIADEPTGNLDSKNSQSIIDLFKTLRDTLGTTIVIATHDQNIAKQADQIIAMKDGSIT